MMKTSMKILKITSISLFALFFGFVVYANLEEPPLHSKVKPVSMTILTVNDLKQNENYLNAQLSKTNGITAFSANTESGLLAITHDPDVLSKESLLKILQDTDSKIAFANFENNEVQGPQCPVPMEYIQKFEQIKYALNFR